ncbi:Checkpoint protein hus1 [Lachnellula hyalina]|uniref:Checkpoint protein n=1 Tax=Lachnellula hyalina TaxID=1316788 RepID=A0A8H8R7B3_9HELO|nr:Checkpoint protein hus1 [Lachnellula hyalina]TVY29030.1 Checkpoint protein hus1 [Lachnellula hyalina]
MRFKTSIRNIQTFSSNTSIQASIIHNLTKSPGLTTSLSSLGKVAWVRLDDDSARFTIIPETGTQVWALRNQSSISIDSIFEDYTIQSAAPNNIINLELPLPPLSRALKSALNASSASIRLTKKDGAPVLSLTIITNTISSGNSANGFLNNSGSGSGNQDPFGDNVFREENLDGGRDREAVVTQDIPVRVLQADSVEGIHEPKVREPDAYIVLPSLIQLKAISDRFTRLTATSTSNSTSKASPKLELAANMHGGLKLRVETDALNIESVWTGLTNPDLDPGQVEGGLEELPSARLKARGPDAWARVRIDGRDWGKVLSVGRMDGRVIACFADENALILYVYLSNYDDGEEHSVLTYYISSFSV